MKHNNEHIHRAPALLSVLMILATGAAFAHTKQEVTFPEDGAVLAAPPDVVAMTFDMPMRITVISLTSDAGDAFDLERTDGMQPVTEFQATPHLLPNGRFSVEWRGLSADGHPMQCRFTFEVAQ